MGVGFTIWNERLLNAFFGDFAADQPVRLAISGDFLDSEFADIGGSSEFLRTTRRGPDWGARFSERFQEATDPFTLLDRALGLHKQWFWKNRRHRDYVEPPNDAPPYIPFLALLSYAWTIDLDGVAANNFFDRLEIIYPNHGLRNRLSEVEPLWSGLEEWSWRLNGRLGVFRVEQLGNMQWVGIPKSQVILTASRVECLPAFFAHLGINPDSEVSTTRFRDLISEQPQIARHYLGLGIVNAIVDNETIGDAAINQLLQHLQIWDGQTPEVGRRAIDCRIRDPQARGPEGTFRLALRPNENNEAWQGEVYFEVDSLPNGLLTADFARRRWIANLIDGFAGPFVSEAGGKLSGFDLISAVASFQVTLGWSDDVDGGARLEGRWDFRRVIAFQWQDNVLLEQGSFPSEGDAYVLLDETFLSSMRDWLSRISAGQRPDVLEAIPQIGVVTGWRLLYISQLERLTDREWSAFPGLDSDIRVRRKPLQLRGGTRALRNAVRRVYASYDPPKVFLNSESGLELDVKGATVEELQSLLTIPAWLPKSLVRQNRIFRISPIKGQSVVTLIAMKNGMEEARISFGLQNSANVSDLSAREDFSIGALGESCADSLGALGVIAPPPQHPWAFVDGAHLKGRPASVARHFDSAANILLEWLSAHRRVPFSRLRDFAVEQLSIRRLPSSPNREARALSLLGHLEIQVDARGRWSTIHSVPASIYLLPLKRQGQFQAILGGSYTREQGQSLINAATALSVDVEVSYQPCTGSMAFQLVPPRVCILCSQLETLELIASDADIAWVATPPAYSYAHWSAGLNDWFEHLPFFPEVGPGALATYRPNDFRTRDGDVAYGLGKSKLKRFEDQITRRHFQYALEIADIQSPRHAYIPQRAWATWYVHHDAMRGLWRFLKEPDEFMVPIAYTDETRAVVVPQELELPLVLSRALTFCSGVVPDVITPETCAAYADSTVGFTPGPPYLGHCLAYPNVPREIATMVLNKVEAIPRPYPPLPRLTLSMPKE